MGVVLAIAHFAVPPVGASSNLRQYASLVAPVLLGTKRLEKVSNKVFDSKRVSCGCGCGLRLWVAGFGFGIGYSVVGVVVVVVLT